VRCTDTERSFASCKTKDDYLKAFGIPEGPDKDEMCKLIDGLNPSTSAGHASSNNKIHACLFSLLATLTGLGVTNGPVTESELWRQYAIGSAHVMANFHTKESTTMVYYGLPSGDSRACFISGSVALARTNTSLLINRNISALGKESRRAIDALQEPTTPVTPKRQKTSPGESTKQVQVNFTNLVTVTTVKTTNSMDSLNAAKMRIDALKMKVDLLQQLGSSQEEIRSATMDLLAALDALGTLAPPTTS